jgi:hypothetical protein
MQIPAVAAVGAVDAIIPMHAGWRRAVGLGLAFIAFGFAKA